MISMNQMIFKMKTLKEMMIDVSEDMQYYGGFNQELFEKSKELIGASMILDDWINSLEFPKTI